MSTGEFDAAELRPLDAFDTVVFGETLIEEGEGGVEEFAEGAVLAQHAVEEEARLLLHEMRFHHCAVAHQGLRQRQAQHPGGQAGLRVDEGFIDENELGSRVFQAAGAGDQIRWRIGILTVRDDGQDACRLTRGQAGRAVFPHRRDACAA